MSQFERNIILSFKRARKDIVKLQEQILQLINSQTLLAERIDKINTKNIVKNVKIVKAPVAKSRTKSFIASKTGKKFHIPECIFTKNIKPKSMVKFKSKNTALNAGYKPCDCVK